MIKIISCVGDLKGFDISLFYRVYVASTMSASAFDIVAIASTAEEARDAQEMFADLKRGTYYVDAPFREQN